MKEEERRRFESILSLRQAAYDSFNDRRVYEWKFNLAIWTALAIIIAGLLQPLKDGGGKLPLGCHAWICAAIIGVLVVLLHGYWSDRAARANDIDKSVARHYTNHMQSSLLNLPFDEELQQKINNYPKRVGWRQWSHLAQIGITATLALTIVVLIYVRCR